MEARKYADAFSIHPTFSLVRENRDEYDVEAKRTREDKTDALRAENAELAAQRNARERAKEVEREKTHGPRVRFEMVDGLRANDVDRAIFRGRRAGDIGHRTVAFYLADCADRGLYQELGHSSVITYAVKRHDLSRRAARNLIAAGRALRELSKIDQAFAKAEISWSKVRAIARVADFSTEERWLAYAKTHTLEEVEKEAALCKKGEQPREDRRGLPEVRFDLRLRVSALLHEQYLLARQKLGADVGRDVTDEEFAGAVLETFLRKPAEGNQSSDSLYRVVLDLRPAEKEVTIRSEDGPIDLDAARAEAICCDAGVVSENGAPHGPHAPPISEGLRNRILARDGWRCRVCQNRFQLHVHHIVFRSEHGSNVWANLMTLCDKCHTLVHGRYLTITGRAPDRLECRDRSGELLVDPARVLAESDRTSLEIVPPPASVDCSPSLLLTSSSRGEDATGGGPAGPGNSGFAAEKLGVVTTVPPGPVDGDWLLRHRHLLTRVEGRSAFRLEAGARLTAAPASLPMTVSDGESHVWGDALRPVTFDRVVGQEKAVARLRTYVEAAERTHRRPLPVLLLGASGLGKTTLARAYAYEFGCVVKTIDCTTVANPLELVDYLLGLEPEDLVFLDEVHALPRKVAECLYPAIEDGVVNLPLIDGPGIRNLAVQLPPVTFVAATTNPERMPSPLRNRFRTIELSPYSVEDLAEIVLGAAGRDGFAVDPAAASVLARASSGTARMAIGLFLEMRVWVEAQGRKSATADDAWTTLRCAELDENGFGPIHRRILAILRTHGRPLAHHRLLAQLGLSAEAYRTLYEPALIRTGLIVSTPRGLALAAGINSAAATSSE